jgi:hypothetical protein
MDLPLCVERHAFEAQCGRIAAAQDDHELSPKASRKTFMPGVSNPAADVTSRCRTNPMPLAVTAGGAV